MQAGQATDGKKVFQAPAPYVAIFYGILLVWTIGTVPVIYQRFQQGAFGGDWWYAGMIGFFYLFTWFWALGLSYRVAIDGEGRIEFNSLRRTLVVPANQVRAILGSRFSGGFGFVRLKLPRESVYIFCYRRKGPLEEIFQEIRRRQPLTRTERV